MSRTYIKVFPGILIGIGIGIVILFGFRSEFVNIPGSSSKQGVYPVAPNVDSPAPGFTLNSLSGEQISLEQYTGRPLMINFWATWCGPCRLEMPLFQSYHEKYGTEFTILAVNVGETEAEVQAFVDQMSLDFDILMDKNGEVESLYRIRGYPSTYFMDEDGKIRILHLGMMSESQLIGYLEELGIIQ